MFLVTWRLWEVTERGPFSLPDTVSARQLCNSCHGSKHLLWHFAFDEINYISCLQHHKLRYGEPFNPTLLKLLTPGPVKERNRTNTQVKTRCIVEAENEMWLGCVVIDIMLSYRNMIRLLYLLLVWLHFSIWPILILSVFQPIIIDSVCFCCYIN